MIREALSKLSSEDQRGGIAILTALGFLLFSVPLITSSLDLAQATAIDARFKSEITKQHYAGIAVGEYFDYLVNDISRWDDWLATNTDGGDPAVYTETRDAGGQDIDIQVSQEAVLSPILVDDSLDDTIIIPSINAYNDRDFQVTETVSDSNPTGGTSVVYTITVANRTSSTKWVDEIKAYINSDFIYDCDASADQLTLPGEPPEDITPDHRSHAHFCEDDGDRNITWDIGFLDGFIASEEEITLTYTVVTSASSGTYCSEAKVKPDEDHNHTGQTAIVQIGSTPGLCPDEAMVVTKTWTSATLVSTNTSTTPYTYTFNFDYEIKFDNIGSDDLNINEINDLLPLGFLYSSMDISGDISDSPESTSIDGTTGREEIIWNFSPDVSVTSGTSQTLKYTAVATVTRGNYWSDVLTEFGTDYFDEDKYTWPTAMIAIRDVFLNTASTSDGTVVSILKVNIAADAGLVSDWDLP